MSTFINNTQQRLILPTPTGAQRILNPGDQFDGSNYYKRFVGSDGLTLATDDGATWAVGEPSAGSVKRTRTIVVDNASVYDDNQIDLVALIGAAAHYIQIECTAGEVLYRFNGDTNAEAGTILSNGETQTFERYDFLASSIEFDASYSGATGGTVTVTAIGNVEE